MSISIGVAMAKNYYNITLAIAGISQSAWIVWDLANRGQCDQEAFHTSLRSLLEINPTSTLSVFGGQERNLRPGLNTMLNILTANHKGEGYDITRYALNLISLERKLRFNKKAMKTLGTALYQINYKWKHFLLESNSTIRELASLYVDVISPLGPRIQVTGSSVILQDPCIQSKIRAALLAGVRSSVLWKQVGGSRLQLIFSRHHLINQAKNIIFDY